MKEDSKFAPEPKKMWKRINYNCDMLKDLAPRDRAERETTRDLTKCVEQLLCDFHDMAEDLLAEKNPSPEKIQMRTLHAQKRMVGMMAKVAKSNEVLSRRMHHLTIAMTVMTAVILILTAVMVSVT